MHIEIDREHLPSPARIKVVGVGGAGGNAVHRMIDAGLEGVEFVAINTDLKALQTSRASIKVQIGSKITKGLGAGARPEVGRQAAEESREAIAECLSGCDMVFVAAGMGGGTGTGAAPVVAHVARDLGLLTVAVVTMPFSFEGMHRRVNARRGLEELRRADTWIVIPNDKLLSTSEKRTTLNDAFRKADDVLTQATRGICDIITRNGLMQLDFADVATIMRDSGEALIGSGRASGDGRALAAAEAALHGQLLDNVDITGARGLLVNFTAASAGILELQDAMDYFREALGSEAEDNTIMGVIEDPEAGEEFRVTLIATGFPDRGSSMAAPVAAPISASVAVATPVNVSPAIPRLGGGRAVPAAEAARRPGASVDAWKPASVPVVPAVQHLPQAHMGVDGLPLHIAPVAPRRAVPSPSYIPDYLDDDTGTRHGTRI